LWAKVTIKFKTWLKSRLQRELGPTLILLFVWASTRGICGLDLVPYLLKFWELAFLMLVSVLVIYQNVKRLNGFNAA
jgi:hypothetical protein